MLRKWKGVAAEDIWNLPRTICIPKGSEITVRQIFGVSDHFNVEAQDGTELSYVPERFIRFQ